MDCSLEEDLITRLLDKSGIVEGIDLDIGLKSIHDEFLEVGESPSIHDYNNNDEDDIRYEQQLPRKVSPRELTQEKTNCFSRANKTLNCHLNEFVQLSSIMDREISLFKSKHVREQKESLNAKEEGKVEVLKDLLLAQISKNKNRQIEYEKAVCKVQLDFQEKVCNLQNDVSSQATSCKELKTKYNRTLDNKEQEIEDLISENVDLRNEVLAKEADCKELANENEELEDKVDIKDDYISSLRLQIKSLETQHQQIKWRLNQNEDILEMVENERDHIEIELKCTISELNHELNPNNSTSVINKHSYTQDLLQNTSKTFSQEDNFNNTPSANGYMTPSKTKSKTKISPLQEMPTVLQSLGWSPEILRKKR